MRGGNPMKMRQSIKRALMISVLLLWALCFVRPVCAAAGPDAGKTSSLTLFFGSGSAGFSGVEFRLYRVADMTGAGAFSLTGDFRNYSVSLTDLDSSGWRALAGTLETYAARDQIAPDKRSSTDNGGTVVFDGLGAGLYLIAGDSCSAGGYTYTPEAFLISLPGLIGETGEWVYSETAECKYTREPVSSEHDTVSRKVLKVWKDDGQEGRRPKEIAVQLLKDGKVEDTVTLNQDNNWRHTWTGLDGDARWQVAEYRVPDGYTVSAEREGITFVVTNTYKDKGGSGGGSSGDSAGVLPQTGALWWPVPLLAFGGLLLFLTGWARWRKSEDMDE